MHHIMPKVLERRVKRDLIVDTDHGETVLSEDAVEIRETANTALETTEDSIRQVLHCLHMHIPGQAVGICETCSAKAGETKYVCSRCQVTDPTGESGCVRCTVVGPDGRRYTPKGLKKARRLGLFKQAAYPNGQTPRRLPFLGWFQRILRWW